MQLTKLTLSGFKSFVDTTEVDIPPGLTGIVGPNGCGKSNTVEGLRWVMGETRAKALRGGGMDDVIFAGTRARPARNIAEVRLLLDNSARNAPPQFNDADILEIRRRIERGAGSDYTLNGKPIRARDVQTLLADVAAGASSSAMISQGKVAAIVNAKPQERRQILEEAAGVAGLRARRREAELKLQGAETNLTRVDDVVQGLETNLAALKKQARQAVRYRELSEKIQRLEGLFLRQDYLRVLAEWQNATSAQNEADTAVAAATASVTAAAADEANATARMPELRDMAVQSAAALQRLRIADEQLADEETRAAQRLMQVVVAQNETARDIAHQEEQLFEAATADALYQTELSTLNSADEAATETARLAAEQLTAAQSTHGSAQQDYDARRREAMENASQRGQWTREVAQLSARTENLTTEAEAILRRQGELTEQLASDVALQEAETAHDAARTARDAAQTLVEQQSELRRQAEADVQRARSEESKAREAQASLQGEHGALEKLLAEDHDHDEAVIENLNVPQGLENAIAAAFGEAARASLDPAHSSYWQNLPGLDAPSLPHGLPALASRIQDAPAALARLLDWVAIAPDDVSAAIAAADLKPGQMVVTSDGGLWRWDGYTVKSGAMTAAARRLMQRNRAKELAAAVTAQKEILESAAAARESAERLFHEADQSLRRAQSELQSAQRALEEAQGHVTAAREAQSSARQEQLMLQELARKNAETRAEVQANLTRAEESLAALAPEADMQSAAEAAKAALDAAFSALREAQVAHDHLQYQSEARARRREEITQQAGQNDQRRARAAERLGELVQRTYAQDTERKALQEQPEQIRAQRGALLQELQNADHAQQQATQRLQDAEAELREKTHALKDAEAALANAREARLRLDTAAALAEHRQQEIDAKAMALANVAAKDLSQHFEFTDLEMDRDADDVRQECDRALRSREAIGPVNLRADMEAQELEAQLSSVSAEKAELVAAIARLRAGIGHLNREARERMREAFTIVSHHFTQLFERLFSGGTAELKMVDSDDPLEAGLEIVAQPPGKKLQSLSLLSGGEQALTALSLIFAMFKSKPAPICVLDEVDAPLDDANVDRFCTLLEEMAKNNHTRFLIISHHRLTMARMHRLYGVTMREPGVSQLVSVDLNRAAAIVEQQAA